MLSLAITRCLFAIQLLPTLIHPTVAKPLHRHEIEEIGQVIADRLLHKRQDSGPFTPITGVTGFGTPPRLEIRELQKNADQWNIYILGLDRFMKTDQTEKLSYYQICGIHGRPYIPWDNVGPFEGNTGGPGYCTHVSNIFLPWHRPYLALYEQALYSHMVDIVNTFPSGDQRARYAQAAVSWRHPYWDWATPPTDGGSVYPSSFMNKTIDVTLPNGTTTIDNPLFAYKFHNVSVSDFFYNPFASWNETKRYPTSWAQNAVSQNELIAGAMDNQRPSLQQRLYNLFTNYDNFTEFGNEAWYYGSEPGNADSLESVHDLIHAITGQSGHMTYLDYSAFDPIFWLHHTMIDRLFALFQALHPDSYVEPMDAIEQTFTIPRGQRLDDKTVLDPFHINASGDKHTSQTVRDLTTFGYTYPELVGNYTTSSVKAAINNLYGSNAGLKVLTSRGLADAFGPQPHVKRASTAMQLSKLPGETTSEGRRKQYILNLQSEKFALNGSYAIYIFLGYFNEEDVSSWPLAPNLVGTHAVFTALSGDPAGSGLQTGSGPPTMMSMMGNVSVTGTVPLTSVLLQRVQDGDLEGMDDDSVEAYLEQNLRWRAAMFDNTAVPLSDVAGLDISVVRAEVKPAKSRDAFPTWGNFVTLKQLKQPSGDTSCPA